MIADGCHIEPNCSIRGSVVGLRTIVRNDCVIEDCLLMGCDYYETQEDCDTTASCVPMGIGERSCGPHSCVVVLFLACLFASL